MVKNKTKNIKNYYLLIIIIIIIIIAIMNNILKDKTKS